MGSELKFEEPMDQKDFFLLKDIKEELESIFGSENVWLQDTWYKENALDEYSGNRTSKKGQWADITVERIYGKEGLNGLENSVHFSYIKFGFKTDKKGNQIGPIVGIAGCKSSFAKYKKSCYCSDLNFENKTNTKKAQKRTELMGKNHFKWYKNEILILKNKNDQDAKEARDKEKMLQEKYNLFD